VFITLWNATNNAPSYATGARSTQAGQGDSISTQQQAMAFLMAFGLAPTGIT